MRWLWRLLVPIGPIRLFLESKMWYRKIVVGGRVLQPGGLSTVGDPGQVGPNRSDPSHYDELGRYLWWGC